jgi:hypothetical protein
MMQHLVDHGVVGLVLFLVWVFGALWAGFSGGANWQVVCLATALVALLVCGVGFHTFYAIPTNLLFWFMTTKLWQQAGPTDIALHGTTFLYIAIPVCMVVLLLTARVLVFDVLFQRYCSTGSQRVRDWLLEHFPRSGMLHDYVSLDYASKCQPKFIVRHAALAIAHYDGLDKLWEAWANLGSGFMMLGALTPSEMCYKESINLWPEFERGHRSLQQLQDIRQAMQEGRGVMLQYEPSGKNSQTNSQKQPTSEQVGGLVHPSPEPV